MGEANRARAFRAACAGAAEMLARLAHLDNFPDGADALGLLRMKIDGAARRIEIGFKAAQQGADGHGAGRRRWPLSGDSGQPSPAPFDQEQACPSRKAQQMEGADERG